MSNLNFKYHLLRKKLPKSFKIERRYLFPLVLAISVIGINYSYSISMMILTTFILAYLSKGSRRR